MIKKQPKPKGPFANPKGMRDIIGDDYYRYQGFFEKAQEIAVYYGFKPIETPMLEKEDVFTSGVGEDTDIVQKEMYTLKTKGGDKLVLRPEATASIVRAYIQHGMQSLPQPVMFYYYGPLFRHERPQRGRFREHYQFGLEILGTSKSVADALIIQTIVTILKEVGFSDLTVCVNSLGDKESRSAYVKELVSYYRKHAGKLCTHCRERLKTNPLRLLDCKEEKCWTLKAGAPESVTYLTPDSKKHFKEVLEYLESMNIPYTIDSTLVRGLDYYSQTVFEIMDSTGPKETTAPENTEQSENNTDSVKDTADTVNKEPDDAEPKALAIAGGGRYDSLARQLGSKKDIPGVGAAIGVDRLLMQKYVKDIMPKIFKKPKVYFVQLGFEAKLKSLPILETLRKAKIPIMQGLAKDSIAAQLATAEKLNIPTVLIFGQKEAMSNTVIVRKLDTRSQDTVSIDNLPAYLKKLK
ncbi:MAG: histidine--tRNA ligase [Candidatus Lloydbacteria bacterium CG22_combo_CG10-13_8_21_14_all_47_15]|uniref:Histidine--tRNA ligase n=1 Tax=Candidatus Lloydbacteria bacterium CG22_combo_CG10-13_8_21_14_all_47_15 TaxID=1974635 RepID=A0A2H0CVF1_9BACT|nr:MAG: histidine--tRNA ligase [Candidatus Lloydbacteria bacterium CG22_combo_CG10-13_8_21_14_all_47_15]